ncbi:MAG: SEC-C domain-containing protein, partial [Bifidobacteriaceae bacterium]|nr:SEC-C domain-containing protein [Bifidobacteriaceae bacterium]
AIKEQVVGYLFNLQVTREEAPPAAAHDADRSGPAAPSSSVEVREAPAGDDATGSAAASRTPKAAQGGTTGKPGARQRDPRTAAPATARTSAKSGGAAKPSGVLGARPGAQSGPAAGAAHPILLAKGLEGARPPVGALQYSAPDQDGGEAPVVRRMSGGAASAAQEPVEAYPGTGLNQPCPCGSGKKYKMCHGRRK